MRNVTVPYSRDESDRRFAHVDKAGVIDGTGGIQFGNETLSTYDEGTWTPNLAFGGAKVGLTYSSRSGSYVRIGKLVWVMASLVLTAKGSSTGQAVLSGLPYTVSGTTALALYAEYATGLAGMLQALAVTGTTTINFYDHNHTDAPATAQSGDFADTTAIFLNGCYRIA